MRRNTNTIKIVLETPNEERGFEMYSYVFEICKINCILIIILFIYQEGDYPSRTQWSLYVTSVIILQFYIIPALCIYGFCVDQRTKSYYFHTQYQLTGLYKRYLNLYSTEITICTTSLHLIILRSPRTKNLCFSCT